MTKRDHKELQAIRRLIESINYCPDEEGSSAIMEELEDLKARVQVLEILLTAEGEQCL